MEIRVESKGSCCSRPGPSNLALLMPPLAQQRLSIQACSRAVTQPHIPTGDSRATASRLHPQREKEVVSASPFCFALSWLMVWFHSMSEAQAGHLLTGDVSVFLGPR